MPTGVSTRQIKAKALELLEQNHDGLRYSDLIEQIHSALPDANVNTIHGTIWDLHQQEGSGVIKPERGLFILSRYWASARPSHAAHAPVASTRDETVFYEPFKDFLQHDPEEANFAIVKGGAVMRGWWSTPDIIGTRTIERGAVMRLTTEIITAEVKATVNPQELITGFGQACAYLLFSHKSYLVVPKQTSQVTLSRLDALCRQFGIGLIIFNKDTPETPEFSIKNRAIKHEPDMLYLNDYLSGLLTDIEKHELRL